MALSDTAVRQAKGINPKVHRKQKRQAVQLAAEHTFATVYEKWLAHRKLVLKEGRQSTLTQIQRIFAKDILPALSHRSVYDLKRADLLDVVGRIERRKALSVAKKVRTWFNQLFRYALVIVPDLEHNPASDLDVVALPQPRVRHNPFLRMAELPAFLRTLRRYPGKLQTQLGIRLLLLTGVRTGELRRATPDQFHLDEGLWIIPPDAVKQLQLKMRKEGKASADIPPYIVPLSLQPLEIVRFMLDSVKPAQHYLFPHASDLKQRMSENTLNMALKRLGYESQLTGHGIRGTISTALNEIGYPKVWVEAQLSHADRDKISAAYNHAAYVEQRGRMMQDWADRLDLLEQGQLEAASAHLAIQIGGIPVVTAAENRMALSLPPSVVAPTSQQQVMMTQQEVVAWPTGPAQRLSAVRAPGIGERQAISNIQRERMLLLDILEAPHNLSVSDYAKLAGKSRQCISHEIQVGNLLAISLSNRGQRVPDWQLDPVKRKLTQTVLKRCKGVDAWRIYHALLQSNDSLGGYPPIESVTPDNLHVVVPVVVAHAQYASGNHLNEPGHYNIGISAKDGSMVHHQTNALG